MMFKKKKLCISLQVHVTNRLGQCEDSSSTSTNENELLAKKPRLFGFIVAGSKRENLVNSVREVERYFEEIIHFDDDPLMN